MEGKSERRGLDVLDTFVVYQACISIYLPNLYHLGMKHNRKRPGIQISRIIPIALSFSMPSTATAWWVLQRMVNKLEKTQQVSVHEFDRLCQDSKK